jgi:uncharacterized protein (TIRG00374 family)
MKITKRLFSLVASIVLGVGLLAFVLVKYPIKNVVTTFSHVTPNLVIMYLCISFTIMFLFTVRWNFVMKTMGRNLTIKESLSFRIIDYGISYITPSGKAGGEPIRAALLTTKGIPFREGLANVTTDKSIELSVSVIFFVIGLLILAIGHPLPLGLRIFLVLLSLSLITLIIAFYTRIMKGKPIFSAIYRGLRMHKVSFLAKYQNAVVDFEKPIIKFYNEERTAFFTALFFSMLSILGSMIEYKILLLMLGINANVGVVFMVFSVVGMAFLIPVPMGLGSLEAFQAALFSVLGINSTSGIGLAMITRARDLLWVFIAVILSLYHGTFKRVVREAYNSKYVNPINKVTILRDGKQETLKIKMFRNPAEHKKFIGVNALKKRSSFFKRRKKGEGEL